MAKIVAPPLAPIQGSGTTVDPTSWKAAAADTGDYSNLGIPNASNLTGEQAYIAIEQLALNNPQQWGKIRAQLVAMHAYSGVKTPSFTSNWSSADSSAVQNAIRQYHVSNIPTAGTPAIGVTPAGVSTPKQSFLNFTFDQVKQRKNNGYTNASVASVPLISVPATADLTKTVQDTFLKTTGRYASPDEAASFAKQFQDSILAYGQGKKQKQPLAPGQTASSVDYSAIEAPPAPDVAATNFALKSDPVGAGAQGLNDAMGAWFNSLKGADPNGL